MRGPSLPHEGGKVAKNLLYVAEVAGVSPVLGVRRRALGVCVELAAELAQKSVHGLSALTIGLRRRGGPCLFGFAHFFSPAVIYPIHRLHVGRKSSLRLVAGNGPRKPFPDNHAIPGGFAPRGATSSACWPNGGLVHA